MMVIAESFSCPPLAFVSAGTEKEKVSLTSDLHSISRYCKKTHVDVGTFVTVEFHLGEKLEEEEGRWTHPTHEK